MKKKLLCLSLSLFTLVGCSKEEEKIRIQKELIDDLVGITGNTPALSHEPQQEEEKIYVPVEGVDIDLTQLSATMVYSEVFQMMFYPDEYVGKTIRIAGQFMVYENPETGDLYFATVVADALACCQQGIEYILKDATYPQDYPEPGSYIMITGEFAIYEEHGYQNIHLVDATLW